MHIVRQGVPLPRLSQLDADVMIDAADRYVQKLVEAGGLQGSNEDMGGSMFMYLMTSLLVSHYGPDIITAAAHEMHDTQQELKEQHINKVVSDLRRKDSE